MKSELINKAEEFENRKFKFVTTSDRILAAREAKALSLEINEVYKKTKDTTLMDIMKRLTAVKQRIEKRLKGKPLTA